MIKQWREELKRHGFGRVKRQTYGRVVGDGILQMISCDPTWYLNTRSPVYSEVKRRDRLIQYAVWSLYDEIPEENFYEFWKCLDTSSMWHCCDIRGERFYEVPFMGFDADLKTLCEQGFSYFDGINTHDRLLEEYIRLHMIEYKTLDEMDSYLAVLFLMTGARERAMGTLACYFMNFMWFGRTCERLFEGREKTSVLQENYIETLEWNKRMWSLWKALDCRDDNVVRKHLQCNYERNMELIQKYRIPIVKSYTPMDLSSMTWDAEI